MTNCLSNLRQWSAAVVERQRSMRKEFARQKIVTLIAESIFTVNTDKNMLKTLCWFAVDIQQVRTLECQFKMPIVRLLRFATKKLLARRNKTCFAAQLTLTSINLGKRMTK
jgi:hypothetical protein